jgi:hypothetical protein
MNGEQDINNSQNPAFAHLGYLVEDIWGISWKIFGVSRGRYLGYRHRKTIDHIISKYLYIIHS